jgi:hypothetical protein
MRNLAGRIERLEQRMGLGTNGGLCVIMMKAGQELAFDTDQCLQIMADSGYVLPRPTALLDFGDIPHGTSAAELERHFREYAGRLCQAANRVEETKLARSHR